MLIEFVEDGCVDNEIPGLIRRIRKAWDVASFVVIQETNAEAEIVEDSDFFIEEHGEAGHLVHTDHSDFESDENESTTRERDEKEPSESHCDEQRYPRLQK